MKSLNMALALMSAGFFIGAPAVALEDGMTPRPRRRYSRTSAPAPLADYLNGVPTRQVRRWEARKGGR